MTHRERVIWFKILLTIYVNYKNFKILMGLWFKLCFLIFKEASDTDLEKNFQVKSFN